MIAEVYPTDLQEKVWQKRKHVYEGLSYEVAHAYDILTEVYYDIIQTHVETAPPSSDAFLAAAVELVKLHFISGEAI